MDNEIKSKLNNKYNLSSEDYEMISARIDEKKILLLIFMDFLKTLQRGILLLIIILILL